MLRLSLAIVLFAASPAVVAAQAESPGRLGDPTGGGTRALPAPPVGGPAMRALEGEAPVPSLVARRLRVLQTSLDGLSVADGSNLGDGITSLVSAGIAFTFGAIAKRNDQPMTARYLFVFGGVGIAQSGLAFARPRAGGYASRFSVMPMSTNDEVAARLEYGEASLFHLARVHRALRFSDASLSIGASLGTLPFLLGADGFDKKDGWDWVIVVSAGLSTTMGLISFATRSDAERRWRAYAEMADGEEAPVQAGIRLRGVAPWVSPTGFGSVVDVSF